MVIGTFTLASFANPEPGPDPGRDIYVEREKEPPLSVGGEPEGLEKKPIGVEQELLLPSLSLASQKFCIQPGNTPGRNGS